MGWQRLWRLLMLHVFRSSQALVSTSSSRCCHRVIVLKRFMSTSVGFAGKSVEESHDDLLVAAGSDDRQRTQAATSLCGGTVDRLNRVLSAMPSLTSAIAANSNKILEGFLHLCPDHPRVLTPQFPTTGTLTEASDLLSHLAVESASVFRAMASKDTSIETRKDMQKASRDVMENDMPEASSALSSDCVLSSAFALSLVTAALALSTTYETRDVSRSAASAISFTLQEAKTIHPNLSKNSGTSSALFEDILHALLVETATEFTKEAPHGTDLHILTALARALDVTGCGSSDLAEKALGEVIRISTKSVKDSRNSSSSQPPVDDTEKVAIAAAFACAAQLGHPWRVLRPSVLIDQAISLHLWHAAERICQAVFDQMEVDDAIAIEAACRLVDAALETRTYRMADTFATRFELAAGPSRFLDARYLHACDTIVKVIRKGASSLIERQVERVDKAVDSAASATGKWEAICSERDLDREAYTSVDTASSDIRNFSLSQLEERGDVSTALRLAEVWGMEFSHDEEKLKALLAARREKYLQWEELFPNTPVPNLLSTPEELVKEFFEFRTNERIFGFDVEWADEKAGAALLQISTTNKAILIDVIELSTSVNGVEALESTVGRLFASTSSSLEPAVVVGFCCRQDLSQLQATACPRKDHWLTTTSAVVDLKDCVEAPYGNLGLARCCERYLGKPLDKSEQCSQWTRRPLSPEQRVYAALDAHVCALIYLQTLRANDRDKANHDSIIAKKSRTSDA